MKRLNNKDLISLDRITTDEFHLILETAKKLKAEWKKKRSNKPILKGKTLAMIFEKASLRTRVTFEVAMLHLGGASISLSQTNFKLGERESVSDVAKNLERWTDGIMLRTYAHDNVIKMGKSASIPVINGLSDFSHPCQALADVLTIQEHKGSLKGKKLVYVGDGNNVAVSLAFACAHAGMNFVSVSPEGYMLDRKLLDSVADKADASGAELEITSDYTAAVKDADVIYTDVWTSMGQESEKEKRTEIFKNYCVNESLLANAKDDVIVMHCLPAHRGEEISADVIDGSHSVVFDQSENRLHAQKAVLALLMG